VLLAQATTTSSVPEIVGEPLSTWVVLAAGLAVLVFVLAAGFLARRRIESKR
jgi:hypothetical protein